MRNIYYLLPMFLYLSQTVEATQRETGDCSQLGMEKKKTPGIAILRSNFYPVVIDTPEEDAAKRIQLGDFRFIAIKELVLEVPEITTIEDFKVLCLYGVREIPGMYHAADGREHADLMAIFSEYISRYNKYLLQHYKNNDDSR